MMKPVAKLAVGGIIVVGVTCYMAYVGASASWKYYVTTDECLANPAEFSGSRVRVSGLLAPGSLRVTAGRTQAEFSLQGKTGLLDVICRGPLPDNLAEATEVVVEGRVDASGVVHGDKVLTRCASKYESGKPEQKGPGPVAAQPRGNA